MRHHQGSPGLRSPGAKLGTKPPAARRAWPALVPLTVFALLFAVDRYADRMQQGAQGPSRPSIAFDMCGGESLRSLHGWDARRNFQLTAWRGCACHRRRPPPQAAAAAAAGSPSPARLTLPCRHERRRPEPGRAPAHGAAAAAAAAGGGATAGNGRAACGAAAALLHPHLHQPKIRRQVGAVSRSSGWLRRHRFGGCCFPAGRARWAACRRPSRRCASHRPATSPP